MSFTLKHTQAVCIAATAADSLSRAKSFGIFILNISLWMIG